MAHDANETSEIKLISLSKNTYAKEKSFTEYKNDMVDKLVKKPQRNVKLTNRSEDVSEDDHRTADLSRAEWIGWIAELLPPAVGNTKQDVRNMSTNTFYSP